MKGKSKGNELNPKNFAPAAGQKTLFLAFSRVSRERFCGKKLSVQDGEGGKRRV